ncbi:MAG: aminoacyl-histidine dipeptidase [Bacteroides sp.]|jgi:dipeptidase D|nr:aminoacyl-histidine dipeptidase [Bacteroides sp.]
MERILGHLKPSRVWEHFEDICQVPRPSKKEEKILKFLIAFAEKNKLEWQQDKVGNLLISKPASRGYENRQSVVLQSHVDMVCEKNADTKHDFDHDPIVPRLDGNWVRGTGTTLGADDGIGIAVQLAILEADQIEHGPLECLFTVDEETGLTGAFALEKGFIKSRILLNLDSEDDGELFIGCAGGIDTLVTFPCTKTTPESNHLAYKISVTGLKGGHSGDDINKGRGNANKILNRLLWNFQKMFDIRLSEIQGGNLRNAIAREAFATFTMPQKYKADLRELFEKLSADIRDELKTNEPGLAIACAETGMPDGLIDLNTQQNLFNALYACPHGVMAMSPDIPNLVETSTNLASVKMTPSEIIISTSQRSSLESGKRDLADMVASVFTLAGAKVKHGDGYPGWKPNVNSPILGITEMAYTSLFKEKPKVLAIHAGLECGLIGEKYPGIDMISYGPTIKGAHSPDEGIEIDTVQKFWDLTLEVLKNIPKA